jgi:hypothetical protein
MQMTNREAMTWLQDVNGRLYRTKKKAEKREAWVAVVRAPGTGARTGKMIIALGESAGEATSAAEETWQTLWNDLSNMH